MNIGNKRKKRIYLDYASLTPVDRRVLKEVDKYSSPGFANPSSLYKEGVVAKKALAMARKEVADYIKAHPDEVYFTSGGTEANNIAMIGTIEGLVEEGIPYADLHIIVSVIEHSSVRECANFLNGKGVQVTTISVDKNGVVDLEELRKAIKPNTALISIMTVNNEIGTIEPIRDIAKIIRQSREKFDQTSVFNFQTVVKYPLFHTDAAQAMYEELNVEKMGVDMLTLDGTKVYGPRGVGALYVRRKTPISSVIKGGGQEDGLRSGTENIPGIMGFAKALELSLKERQNEAKRLRELRGLFIEELKAIETEIKLHAEHAKVSPHIVNVSIPGINNEFFVLELDAKGISCSTKSSCLRDEDESYVLKSIGAKSTESVRFSMGRFTEVDDIKKTIKAIKELRAR